MWEAKQIAVESHPGGGSYGQGHLSPTVNWSIDPDQGPLQGPLDLEFFTGKTLCLSLSSNQVALCAREGRLSRLFLGGHHILPVGTGPNQLSPDQRLIFLNLDQPFRFDLTWSDHVVWGQRIRRSLLGTCSLKIKAPQSFYETFLAGNEFLDPAFVQRLIGQVARSSLVEVLAEKVPQPDDLEFQELQDQLLKMKPGVLESRCRPCGLTCDGLSLYTLPDASYARDQGTVPMETAGQSSIIRHN